MPTCIPLCIGDEFGELQSAIVQDASNARDVSMEELCRIITPENLRRHPETGALSAALIREQLERLREILDDAGVLLIQPASQPDAPFQFYTRDPGFVIGEMFYTGSMGERYRDGELRGLEGVRSRVAHAVQLQAQDRKIEGGDIMVLNEGERVLIGRGEITNSKGMLALSDSLFSDGQVHAITTVEHVALHLDTVLMPLPNGKAMVFAEKITRESRKSLERVFGNIIELDPEEARLGLAANVLWLNPEEAISTTAVPMTNSTLRDMGYKVHELRFDQMHKSWGSVRCVVCPTKRGD